MKEEGKGNKNKKEEGEEEEGAKGRTGIWTIMFQKRRKKRNSQLQLQTEETFQKLGSIFWLVSHLSLPASQPPSVVFLLLLLLLLSHFSVSDSVRPHRWKPTRLPRPWDSPSKNTGVGCHFLL